MGRFDGILICTDLDGTLLKKDKTISAENLAAIEYFKKKGGFFTFITGRMPFFVSRFCQSVKPNAPFGCVNGGGLYDDLRQEYIWKSVMPEGVTELIRAVDEECPDVGIQVNTFDRVYFCKENLTMEKFRKSTGLPHLVRAYGEVKEPIAKIVFGSEEDDRVLRGMEVLAAHPLAERFDFIRSEKTLFEILPKGIGKGTAVENLVRHLGLDRNKTVAVGDYNNDISMFAAAKISVAVANANPQTLAAADYVTVSNEESALAKVIGDLENGAFGL